MNGRLVEVSDLTPAQRDAMRALLSEHFDGVTQNQFDRDLREKNFAILLERLGDGSLAGFSTILAYETTGPDGSPLSVIYSGDTIVARDAWGSSALPKSWITSVIELRRRFPRGPYYWLLISSGFRTYRFLPLFWRRFHPHHEQDASPETRRLLDHLARERFGDAFDRTAGVVRFPTPMRLRGELSSIPGERLTDPHVAFFAQRNPDHAAGDELVRLCELSVQNLTSAGRRMVGGASW